MNDSKGMQDANAERDSSRVHALTLKLFVSMVGFDHQGHFWRVTYVLDG